MLASWILVTGLSVIVTQRAWITGGIHALAAQMLVHNMRAPMLLVLAHLDLLRENIRGESVKDLDGAISGARALQRMTNSFLDVSRLEAGRMPVRRSATDLSALAHSVVTAVRVLQPSRDIALHTHGESTCMCDPELTRRIVENLVSNALKHTGVIWVEDGVPRGSVFVVEFPH